MLAVASAEVLPHVWLDIEKMTGVRVKAVSPGVRGVPNYTV